MYQVVYPGPTNMTFLCRPVGRNQVSVSFSLPTELNLSGVTGLCPRCIAIRGETRGRTRKGDAHSRVPLDVRGCCAWPQQEAETALHRPLPSDGPRLLLKVYFCGFFVNKFLISRRTLIAKSTPRRKMGFYSGRKSVYNSTPRRRLFFFYFFYTRAEKAG